MVMDQSQSCLVVESLEEEKGERDVGKLAVWSVSSAKPGNGMWYGVSLWVDGPLMVVCGVLF